VSAITAALTDQRALVAAAQAGDERAFRALVVPYRPMLEVHCYRMLGSLQDAEDVVQEALLRAWRSLDRFHGRSSIHTWLYRIATNACLDELERRPRRPEPVVDPYPDDRLAADPNPGPAARYALREGVELGLLTAVQRLPGRQRAVLILRDVLGWTGPEVADLLDTTVAAVNSALQRARATIEETGAQRDATPVARAGARSRALVGRYVEAWDRSDVDGLVALLAADAELTMPPQRTLTGSRVIVDFFGRVAGGLGHSRAIAQRANGRPAVLIEERDAAGRWAPHRLLVLELDLGPGTDGTADRVGRIHAYGAAAILAAFSSAVDEREQRQHAHEAQPALHRR
jgi:RNA polymerase sigma-70 factor (ECF subfamily)